MWSGTLVERRNKSGTAWGGLARESHEGEGGTAEANKGEGGRTTAEQTKEMERGANNKRTRWWRIWFRTSDELGTVLQ